MNKDKLLFQPLVKLNCHETESINFLRNLSQFKVFKDYTNQNYSDLLFQLNFSKNKVSQSNYKDMVGQVKKWLDKKLGHRFNIYYEGTPFLLYYIQKTLYEDFKVNILLILIFVIVFYLFFNCFKLIGLYFATLFITSSFLIPLFHFFEITLNPLTSSIFIILAIASIEDFIFLVNDYNKTKELKISLNKFRLPSLLTSITTMIGFGSLFLSPIRDIRFFGLFTAVGALLEWFIIFYILPYPLSKLKVNNRFEKVLKIFSKVRPRSIFFYLSIIPFTFSLLTVSKLNIDEKAADLFFDDHPYNKDSIYLEKTRGWQRRVFIKVENIKSFEQVKGFSQKIKGVEKIVEYKSYVNEITEGLNLASKKMIEKELIKSTLYEDLHYLGIPIMVIYLDESSIEAMRKIILKLDLYCKNNNCEVFGRQAEYTRYNKNLLMTLYRSFGVSLTLVSIFIFILSIIKLKKIKLSLLYSALWGPILMLFMFYLLNISLNFTTSIFFSVFIGLAGDNAIMYLFLTKDLEIEKVEALGASSVLISIFSIFGSLALVISGFKFTAILGLVFALGFFLNIVGDLYILKGALRRPL